MSDWNWHEPATRRHTQSIEVIYKNPNSDIYREGNTGPLFFQFAPDENGRMAIVTAANFIPNNESLALLPAIVSGTKPAAIECISLEPAQEAFEQVAKKDEIDRLMQGTEASIIRYVQVVIHEYTASLDCDKRNYFSSRTTVTLLNDQKLAIRESPPFGC